MLTKKITYKIFGLLFFVFLLTGAFLIPAETKAEGLVCKCFYTCTQGSTEFNLGPVAFNTDGTDVTQCENDQLLKKEIIPSFFLATIKDCFTVHVDDSFIIKNLIGNCQEVFSITPAKITVPDDDIGKETSLSVMANLSDPSKQELKSFSCVEGCNDKKSILVGNVLTILWNIPPNISTVDTYSFKVSATVGEDGGSYSLDHEVIVSFSKPEKKAAPVDSEIGKTIAPTVEVDVSPLNQLKTTDVSKLIGWAIKTAMKIIGSIALVMFIYAGALWMLSGQNREYASKARTLLVWTSLGLVVILASYALVDFVFSAFQ